MQYRYLIEWLDKDHQEKQYKKAQRLLKGAYDPKYVHELTDAEKKSIKYIFDGELENKLLGDINTLLEKYTLEEGDFQQPGDGKQQQQQHASEKVLERTQKLLLLLRYAIYCLYVARAKFMLHGCVSNGSPEYENTIKNLYEEEFKKLDKCNTLAYLVFCMKNETVYNNINEQIEGGEGAVDTFWGKIDDVLQDKNKKALYDFQQFQEKIRYEQSKELLPWVYGSGATGDDLPPHLEWAYCASYEAGQGQWVPPDRLSEYSPLQKLKDPSESLLRVCKPFDPKILIAGKERLSVGTKDNVLMKAYVDYLHQGYQQFLTAAKEIPEKNRSRVLEMAQKTQLKEAEELKEEFETLLPFIEEGRAFHTYEQYTKMQKVLYNFQSLYNFQPLQSHFPKELETLTAKQFAAKLNEAKDSGNWVFFSTVNNTLRGIGDIIKFTFEALSAIVSWTTGKLKAAWTYLASSKAGQWAIAAVGDPVRAAKQVRWIGSIIQYAALGFGQYLGSPRETLVAEGDEGTMRELYTQKLIEAEDDVAEIRGKAYDWLLKELKEKKKKELGENVPLEQIGFDDPEHYRTLEKKVEVDFPVRRVFELKEDEKVKGYWRLTEQWSFLGVLASWAQTHTGGMITFDWSLYKKDLDNRKWWGGILSWMNVLKTIVKNAFNKFKRQITHFTVNKALTGLTDYFTDKENIKFLTESVSGLVDSAAALAPLGGPATMLVAGAAKLALRTTVNHVAETVVEECKYALAMNDYWFLLQELTALFDMRFLVDNLFAGSVAGFVSFNSLTIVNLIYHWSTFVSGKAKQVKTLVQTAAQTVKSDDGQVTVGPVSN